MIPFSVSLSADTPVRLDVDGRFVRVMSSSAPFDLTVNDAARAVSVEKGLAFEAPDGARLQALELESATAQTVTLVVSELRVHDSRLTLTDGAVVTVGVADFSQKYFKQTTASGVVEVLAPASNTAGVSIMLAGVAQDGGFLGRIMYHTGTPTGADDANAGTVVFAYDGSTHAEEFGAPFDIPAGEGLYVASSGGNSTFWLGYEVKT